MHKRALTYALGDVHTQQTQAWSDAWHAHHCNFTLSEAQIVDMFIDGIKQGVDHFSILDISSALNVLELYDRSDLLANTIDNYIDKRTPDLKDICVETDLISGVNYHPLLVDRLTQLEQQNLSLVTFDEAMDTLCSNKHLTKGHLARLNATPDDDFYSLLKEWSGARRESLLKVVCKLLPSAQNGNGPMYLQSFRRVFARLGNETPANRKRVMRYGITEAEMHDATR